MKCSSCEGHGVVQIGPPLRPLTPVQVKDLEDWSKLGSHLPGDDPRLFGMCPLCRGSGDSDNLPDLPFIVTPVEVADALIESI